MSKDEVGDYIYGWTGSSAFTEWEQSDGDVKGTVGFRLDDNNYKWECLR